MTASRPRSAPSRSPFAGWRVPLWIFVGIVFALLGQRLYSLSFATHTGVIVIEAEKYRTRLEVSPAERLLPTLHLDVYDADGEVLATDVPLSGALPAKVDLSLKGEAQKKAFEAGRLRARLRHPGLDDADLTLEPVVVDTGADTLRYELRIDRTEDFHQREMRTYVAVRDQYGRPVRDLRAVLGIPLRERPREPGVYDVSLLVRDLLFLLEANRKYFVEVRHQAEAVPEPARHVLELDPRWFAGAAPDQRVVQVQLSDDESPGEIPPPEETPAAVAAETVTPTPEPTPEPVTTPPATSTLVVLAQPLEARITLDGQSRPLAAGEAIEGLSPGRHRVNVSLDGYQEQTRTVRLEAGRTEVLSVSLEAAAPQSGQLVIRVSPFADYWIDGQKVGTNIGRVEMEVSAGAHDVRVQHPLFQAHEWKAAQVQAGETTTLRHDFVAASAFGSLRVTVRGGWGQIHVDGQDTGKVSPNVVDQVTVGRRVVSLHSANGPIAGTERTVVIREGETVEVSYDLSGN